MNEETQTKRGGLSIDPIELVVLGIGRYRYWIVVAATIGLFVGLMQSLSAPNRYRSTGKFLAKYGTREKVTPESVAGIYDSRPKPLGQNDELQILKSDVTFKQVAREIGPENILVPLPDPTADDGPQTPWHVRKTHELQSWLWFGSKGPPDPEVKVERGDMNSPLMISAAALKLKSATGFKAGGQSQIITVSYADSTPERAQEICAKIMEMCQWRHTQVFSGISAPKYLSDHFEEAMRETEVANDKFQQHTEECGFFNIQGAKEQVLKTIVGLDESIADDERRQLEIESELARIEEDLVGIEPTIIDTIVPKETLNPRHQDLTKQIQEEQKKLEGLALQFKPGSDIYQSRKLGIESLIRALEEKLATEERWIQPKAIDKPIDNPRYVKLIDERNSLEREREKRKAGRQSRIDRLAEKRVELQAILDCEPLHRTMKSDISQGSSRVANTLSQAMEKNESLVALSKETEASNLVIIQEASLNPSKVTPERSQALVTGLGIGAGIGAAFAVIRQFLDSRIRFPRTAKRVVGTRVLGVVPEVKSWRKLGTQLKRETQLQREEGSAA